MTNLFNSPGTIHMVLQGKGGVGKSFVASHIAQYFLEREVPAAIFDSDPINRTLSNYAALNARYFNFMAGNDLDLGAFDTMMSSLIDSQDAVVVLDTGSSNFIALLSYLQDGHVFNLLEELGRPVVVHSVLVGGEASRDTLSGFAMLGHIIGNHHVVAWLNDFLGPVQFEGRPFEDTAPYAALRDRLLGTVHLRRRGGANNPLHINAIREMTRRHLTFREAIASAEFWLLDKQRLADARREVREQLDAISGETSVANAS